MIKKILLFIIIGLLIVINLLLLKINNNKQIIEENNTTILDLVFEYNTYIKLSDVINEEINYIINTDEIGEYKIIKDINNKKYIINYKVVDSTNPIIIGNSTITIQKGDKASLVNKFLCGDDYDDNLKCFITGEYDVNNLGSYDLIYNAVDSSNNKTTKKFKLKVVNKREKTKEKEKKQINIKEYIKKYKNDKTQIGIDVSAWQDKIDFKKVKEDGVEFVIIRIGYGRNDMEMDKRFKDNIKNAKINGLKVGLYFYSYASNINEAINEANWIIETLEDEKIDLPIAFDWENWSKFNEYKISFRTLNNISNAFIKEIEKNNYEAMLYSSAYYLNHIWYDYDKVWLAYYTSNNDYRKNYNIWQATSRGKVNGINGNVDIDILYK